MKKSCVCLYHDGKSLIKLLQWPCNERLNALRATSTRKRNCLHKKLLSPPLSEKELITWSRSDEGKIALHLLDRDLRLALRNFFYYTRN